ncbi:MAG TPA: hypothetical protein VHU87_04870, partial [Rhizomicrobium sp.]|nr:hypothetical protein [Rhizomicrobium sp.]
NAIVMPHGVARFPVQNVAKRLEHRRINAMRLVYKFKPDSRGQGPGDPIVVKMTEEVGGADVARLRNQEFSTSKAIGDISERNYAGSQRTRPQRRESSEIYSQKNYRQGS